MVARRWPGEERGNVSRHVTKSAVSRNDEAAVVADRGQGDGTATGIVPRRITEPMMQPAVGTDGGPGGVRRCPTMLCLITSGCDAQPAPRSTSRSVGHWSRQAQVPAAVGRRGDQQGAPSNQRVLGR